MNRPLVERIMERLATLTIHGGPLANDARLLLDDLDELLHAPSAVARRRSRGVYTQREAAAKLRIPVTLLSQHIHRGDVIAPENSLGGLRKYYTAQDIEDLNVQLQRRGLPEHRRKEAGLWSQKDVANATHLSASTVEHHVKMKHIPAPSHRFPKCLGRYWTDEEAEAVKRFLVECGGTVRRVTQKMHNEKNNKSGPAKNNKSGEEE